MDKILRKSLFVGLAMMAAGLAALNTGCASGGFKLTRQYAGWVNSQTLILRVVLYILTMVVFAVTLVIDAVVFNTMDFWEGRVSQGTYEFEKDGQTYVVEHRLRDGLRSSTIEVRQAGRVLKTMSIEETRTGSIEYHENGERKAEVDQISAVPRITYFAKQGQVLKRSELQLPELQPAPVASSVARR